MMYYDKKNKKGESEMGLVDAKCTNCGAVLQVDADKEAAICPYCNSAYIVEKAINNFNITNNVNVQNAVINMNGGVIQMADTVDIDGCLKRGKDSLRFFQFDEAEKSFRKVLDKEANNLVAKNGMMIKCLLEGLISFEKRAKEFWDRVEREGYGAFDEETWRKLIRQLNDESLFKAMSYNKDLEYIYDYIGWRGAKYEKEYRKNPKKIYYYLMFTYYSYMNEMAEKYWHGYDVPAIALKRIHYYDGYKKPVFGDAEKKRLEYISEQKLAKLGLLKKDNDGDLVYFICYNTLHYIEIRNEFLIDPDDKLL